MLEIMLILGNGCAPLRLFQLVQSVADIGLRYDAVWPVDRLTGHRISSEPFRSPSGHPAYPQAHSDSVARTPEWFAELAFRCTLRVQRCQSSHSRAPPRPGDTPAHPHY